MPDLVNLVNLVGCQLKAGYFPISADSVSLSGMGETSRLQAKNDSEAYFALGVSFDPYLMTPVESMLLLGAFTGWGRS